MVRNVIWIVGGVLLSAGWLHAQGPGPSYLPVPLPAPGAGPYGYSGYAPAPPPGMSAPATAPNGMPFGSPNPQGIPSPYPPQGQPSGMNRGMSAVPGSPYGMPFGSPNSRGIPQPFTPYGMPQGASPGQPPLPMGPGGMPYGSPFVGMQPFPPQPQVNPPTPPQVQPGTQTFPPYPTPVTPMLPGANPAVPPFPPMPSPATPFPPMPTPVTPYPGTPYPMTPYPGTPMPIPNQGMPYAPPSNLLPEQLMPNVPPGNGGVAPPGSAEPYMVLPEKIPTNVPPEPHTPPSGPPVSGPHDGQPEFQGEVLSALPTDGSIQPVAYVPPAEPYMLYEGSRYQAEIKEECVHVWMQASYLHWWIRRDMVPPLVTSGPIAAPAAGTLNNPGTQVLVGSTSTIGTLDFSGVQAYAGMWFSEDHQMSLEAGGFWLPAKHASVSSASDAAGTPPLSRPILTPAEGIVVVASPGTVSGSVLVESTFDLHSVELNLAHNLFRLKGWSVDYLLGARYAYLHESLGIRQSSTALVNGALAFPGVGPLAAGSNVVLSDSFEATNRFYGGQIGTRIDWTCCGFDLGVFGKIALGSTIQNVNINGTSTLTTAGATPTLAQGVLAQPTNIGSHPSANFSIASELNVSVGYLLTHSVRVLAGYDLFYWSHLSRAGDQIDRSVSLTQVPTTVLFAPNPAATTPAYTPSRSDFWAHGLNVGLELRY